MAKAIDQAKRGEFFKLLDQGVLVAHAADQVGIGRRTGVVWAKRYRQGGEESPRKEGRPRRSKLDAHYDYFADLMMRQPDLSIDDIIKRLATDKGVTVVKSTLWEYFEKVGLNVDQRSGRLTRA